MYTEIVTSPAAATDAPKPMPTTVLVLRREGFISHDDDDEEELSSELFHCRLVLSSAVEPPRLPLAESASAVALAEAVCALVERLLVGTLVAGVEVGSTVGEEILLGGSVDGTELSLVLGAAVVSLVHFPSEVLHHVPDGPTTGDLGVAHELIDAEVDVGDEDGAGDGTSGAQPAAGSKAVDPSGGAAWLSWKRAPGLSQHCDCSSASPQQNLADAVRFCVRH